MIKEFIINNLVLIYKGTFLAKLNATVKLSVVPALGVSVFEYVTGLYISNLSFLYGVLMVILIDHALGSYLHYFIERDFTFEKNLVGLVKKLMVCISGYSTLIIMHDALNEIEFLDLYFMVLVKLMVLLYPIGSALGSFSKITGGKFPPAGFLKKIKNFEETADLESLKTKTNKDENAEP